MEKLLAHRMFSTPECKANMRFTLLILLGLLLTSRLCLAMSPGFSLPFGQHASIIPFTLYRNLIILHVVINGTLNVNLILDSGGQSIVLFGDKFKDLQMKNRRGVRQVHGYNSNEAEVATLSYPNSVDLGTMHGEGLGLCIVTTRMLFPECPKIDGWMGYDVFLRHFVEINYKDQKLTFSDQLDEEYLSEFEAIPLDNDITKPYIQSTLLVTKKNAQHPRLLIDTGSSLGLTLFSGNRKKYGLLCDAKEIASGISGSIYGVNFLSRELRIGQLRIARPQTYVIDNNLREFCGSLGGEFLKKFIVIFDHASRRVLLKKQLKDKLTTYVNGKAATILNNESTM